MSPFGPLIKIKKKITKIKGKSDENIYRKKQKLCRISVAFHCATC